MCTSTPKPAFERFLAVAARALASERQDRETVSAALAEVTDADLGLEGENLRPSEPIRQQEIFRHPDFCVGLFQLAAGESLPLHDHPRMTVWLKVLGGRLRVRSYDWVEKTGRGGLARQVADREIGPQTAPQVLLADAGNLHEIHALSSVAFLDVFSPYYSAARPCTYYRQRERSGDAGLVWLDAVPEEMARL